MAFPEQGKKYFFDIIFENKNDLVGMMAYTLYKRNKVDFIKDLGSSGTGPNEPL